MALSKDDLVSGLREGLQCKSYLNDATMPLTSMVEYIDLNVHGKANEILAQMKGVSKVGGNEMSLMEFVLWCDYHLNKTVPDVVRSQARLAPTFNLIRHKDTGAVYAWRFDPVRPVFFHVKNDDELHFLASAPLSGGWGEVVDAETNLVEFVLGVLRRFGQDTSQLEEIIPPPPPTTYTVVGGDTFSGIAAKLGVSVDALKAANPQVTNINAIDIGQVLNVPK